MLLPMDPPPGSTHWSDVRLEQSRTHLPERQTASPRRSTGFVIVYGVHLVSLVAPNRLPASNLSQAAVALAIPVSAGFMLVHKTRDRIIRATWRSSLACLVIVIGAVLVFTGSFASSSAPFYILLVAGGVIFLSGGLPVAESLFMCAIIAYDIVTPAPPNVAIAQYTYDGIQPHFRTSLFHCSS